MDPVQNAVAAFLNAIQSAQQAQPALELPPQTALNALLGQDLSLVFQGSGPGGLQFSLPSGQTVTAQGDFPYAVGTQVQVRVTGDAGSVRLQTLQALPPSQPAILAPLVQGEGSYLQARLTQQEAPPELEPLVQLFRLLGGAEPQGPSSQAAAPDTGAASAQAAPQTPAQAPVQATAQVPGETTSQATPQTSAQAPAQAPAQATPQTSAQATAQAPAQATPQTSAQATAQAPAQAAAQTASAPASQNGLAPDTLPLPPAPTVPASAQGAQGGAPAAQGQPAAELQVQLSAPATPAAPTQAPAQAQLQVQGQPPAQVPAPSQNQAALDAPAQPAALAAPTLDPAAQVAKDLATLVQAQPPAAQAQLPTPDALLTVAKALPAPTLQALATALQKGAPEPAAALEAVQRLQTTLARLPDLPPGQGDALVQLIRNLVRAPDPSSSTGRAPQLPLPQGSSAQAAASPAASPESWQAWLKEGMKALSDPAVSPREAPFHAAQAKEGTALYELPLPWAPGSSMQVWVEQDGQGQGKGAKGGRSTRVLLGLNFSRLGEVRLGLSRGPEGLQVRVWAEHPQALLDARASMEAELKTLGTPVDLKIMPLESGPGGGVPSIRSLAAGSTFQVLG